MTKKYVSYVDQFLSTKNKLQEAVKTLIKENNRLVIDETKVEEFKNSLISKVEALNEQYPRCTPVKIKFWHRKYDYLEKDIICDGADFIRFRFLECTEV